MFPGLENTRHQGYVLHYPGTRFSSDMCSPTRETHIPSKMCFPYLGTHIPSDMYSPPRPRKEHKSQVICVPQPVKHIPEGNTVYK